MYSLTRFDCIYHLSLVYIQNAAFIVENTTLVASLGHALIDVIHGMYEYMCVYFTRYSQIDNISIYIAPKSVLLSYRVFTNPRFKFGRVSTMSLY